MTHNGGHNRLASQAGSAQTRTVLHAMATTSRLLDKVQSNILVNGCCANGVDHGNHRTQEPDRPQIDQGISIFFIHLHTASNED